MEPLADMNKPEIAVRYFEVTDSLTAPQDSDASTSDQYVYCQFQASFEREQYEIMSMLSKEQTQHKSQQRAELMIFADKSGSMSGSPFTSLKEGLTQLSPEIYGENEEGGGQIFSKVHVVFYSSERFVRVPATRTDFDNMVNAEKPGGLTNFVDCFNYIITEVNQADENTHFSIVFLTDGNETANHKNKLNETRDFMKDTLKVQAASGNKTSAIYALGFSKDHDAELLNFLAQSGSEMGNFIYIDRETQHAGGYQQLMKDSFRECINEAVQNAGSCKRLVIKNDNPDFGHVLDLKTDYVIATKGADDPQSAVMDSEMQNAEKELEWVAVDYLASCLMRKADLEKQELQLTLKLGRDFTLECRPAILRITDASQNLQCLAELEYINRCTFDLIQQLQKAQTKESRSAAFERLKIIDNTLDQRMEQFMQIKNRKQRKELTQQLQKCKQRTSYVVSILRRVQDLSHLPNDIIAQINDHAFKAIQKGKLNKMLDKRALVNEDYYEKLDKEVESIVDKLNFVDLAAKHKEVINEVGDCCLSCLSAVEALEQGDAMCIGLIIDRPEAAIADPSRLIIKDVIPTYATCDSYLDAARFKLTQGDDSEDVHGGFKKSGAQAPNQAQVLKGLGNENINGVMPLFMFPEHWSVAKRRIAPIFGFMCTLDVLGYSGEQLEVIPFLVLMRALEKHRSKPSEVSERVLRQILDTCVKILSSNTKLRNKIVNQLYEFAYPEAEASTRTPDVIKSIPVLMAQFYALLRVENLYESCLEVTEERKVHFQDATNLQKLKERVVRFGVEELVRRVTNDKAENLTSQVSRFMVDDSVKFINRVFNARELEIREADTSAQQANKKDYSMYDEEVKNLKIKYGYIPEGTTDQNDEEKKASEAADAEPKEEKTEKTKVDFQSELNEFLDANNFTVTGTMRKIVEDLDAKFAPDSFTYMYPVLRIAEFLLERPYCSIDSIFKVPLFDVEADDSKRVTFMAAIILQNSYHWRNNYRRDACKHGDYVEFTCANQAKAYLTDKIRADLTGQFNFKVNSLLESLQSKVADATIQDFLNAPNVFVAALILRNKLQFAKGDFKNAITMIGQQMDSVDNIADLAHKLHLLKTGYLFHKRAMPQLCNPDADFEEDCSLNFVQDLGEKDKVNPQVAMKLFSDANRQLRKHVDYAVHSKDVFRIWAKHVYKDNQANQQKEVAVDWNTFGLQPTYGITQAQLENLFPEYRSKIKFYGMCCNKQGQIVRNHAYWLDYQDSTHKSSKRGGNNPCRESGQLFKAIENLNREKYLEKKAATDNEKK